MRKPKRCGTVHVEIHAGGNRFVTTPVRTESGHVCDVEVDLERGPYRLLGPERSDFDDVFETYVDAGHDGYNAYVRRRIACGDASQSVEELLQYVLRELSKAVIEAKRPDRRPNGTDHAGRPNMVRVVGVSLRCRSGRHRSTTIAWEIAYYCERAGYTWSVHQDSLYRGVRPLPNVAAHIDGRGPCGCHLRLCRINREANAGRRSEERRDAEEQENRAHAIADQAFERMMAAPLSRIVRVDEQPVS